MRWVADRCSGGTRCARCVAGAHRAELTPLPDLSGYRGGYIHAFDSYYDSPTTNGGRRVTPDGFRCRITHTDRANLAMRGAECWGNLSKAVFDSAAVRVDPAPWSHVSLCDQKIHSDAPDINRPREQFGCRQSAARRQHAGLSQFGDLRAVTDTANHLGRGEQGFGLALMAPGPFDRSARGELSVWL